MLLTLQAIRVDTRWTVDTQRHVFMADASDLGFRPGEVPSVQLYDDAADVGIALFNPASGNTTHWYENQSSSNERYWHFLPTTETLRRFPRLATWCVRIYND